MCRNIKPIDFIGGNTVAFYGDSIVITDALLRNFNLKASHIKDRLNINENILFPEMHNIILNCNQTKILLLDESIVNINAINKIPVDVIILSGKINNSITDLNKIFKCKKYIATSNISTWKCAQWKKDCEQLHLRFHSVAQQSAAVINI